MTQKIIVFAGAAQSGKSTNGNQMTDLEYIDNEIRLGKEYIDYTKPERRKNRIILGIPNRFIVLMFILFNLLYIIVRLLIF